MMRCRLYTVYTESSRRSMPSMNFSSFAVIRVREDEREANGGVHEGRPRATEKARAGT